MPTQKKALITGITGQDGAYLAELLLKNGYKVYGGYRRCSTPNTWRLDELGITKNIEFVAIDLLEYSNIHRLITLIAPHEIYNLAAQSFVGISFEQPIYTCDADGLGVLRLLEAIRTIDPNIKFYQASTSEMFGKVQEIPQTITTPFYPRSPYGTAKLLAHWSTVNYRESYNLFCVSGILFNHESPLRGVEFVTRKITQGLANIYYGQSEKIELGNLEARRDWGHAADYVRAMHAMLQQASPIDTVIATGKIFSIKEFIEIAAKHIQIEIAWEGTGAATKGINKKDGKVLISVNPIYYRPNEVEQLIGSPERAYSQLNWKPMISFEALVKEMMEADLRRVSFQLQRKPTPEFASV